jgi:hypothetical protein
LSGIRRTIGAAAVRKKPAACDIVLGIVGGRGACSANFATAPSCCWVLWHSDVPSSWPLNLVDIEWTTEGPLVTIRRSKTDQEGSAAGSASRGVTSHIQWRRFGLGLRRLASAKELYSAVFNSRSQRVGDQRLSCPQRRQRGQGCAAKLGFDPATFGGLSLRSGLVTTAVKRGVCDQTGHKSLEMLRVYSRDAEAFAGNTAAGLL